jgi:NADH-quinone oxidoreductase subunit H
VRLLAADPLLAGGVGWAEVWRVIAKTFIAFGFLLTAVALMIWFERKLIAGMQNRIGPNRAGPFGLLQTLADGLKIAMKEDLMPAKANRFVYRLAPILSVVPAFLVFCIIPIGGDWSGGDEATGQISLFGRWTYLQLADPPVGILFFLAMSSLAVYGIMLAGWASGSKYPLLGSVRASAQMISYEAALGMSVATVILVAGSLSTHVIVGEQNGFTNMNLIVTGFVPFVIFVIAATAELNRPPFDLVEAEQELVGGFHTEYASVGFMMFYLAEFMNTVTMSAIIVTLFLGGPTPWVDVNVPFVSAQFESIIWFFFKIGFFLFMYVWFRATLPRLRYDQLMDLGWKVLIPLSFAWFLVLATLRVVRNEDWSLGATVGVGAAALGVGLIGYGLLVAAIRTAAHNRALNAGKTF